MPQPAPQPLNYSSPSTSGTAPLDYAGKRPGGPNPSWGVESLRVGFGCWAAYFCLGLIYGFMTTFWKPSSHPEWHRILNMILGGLLFPLTVFALYGFYSACVSLKNERGAWLGIIGILVNFVAMVAVVLIAML